MEMIHMNLQKGFMMYVYRNLKLSYYHNIWWIIYYKGFIKTHEWANIMWKSMEPSSLHNV